MLLSPPPVPSRSFAEPPPPPPPIAHTAPKPPPVPPPKLERFADPQLAALAEHVERQRTRRDTQFFMFTAIPGGLFSAAIHLLLLIAFGLFMLAQPDLGASIISIVVASADEDAEEPALEELAIEFEPLPEEMAGASDEIAWELDQSEETPELIADELSDVLAVVPDLNAATVKPLSASSGRGQGAGDGSGEVPTGFAGRVSRRKQGTAYGATFDSENAVDLALEWIVRHQTPSGAWSFDHRSDAHLCKPCGCDCPGRTNAKNGATAMALLPLLGAGNTHLQGKYPDEVQRGLKFLLKQQKPDGSFMDGGGNMYSHGLATLALCEVLGMTRYQFGNSLPRRIDYDDQGLPIITDVREPSDIDIDKLRRAAQRAVRFIEQAQHKGGGWRYGPKQPGDMSVVGWQMMALKSAHLAELQIDPRTIAGSVRFLDSVAQDRIGSCYSYMGRQRRRAGIEMDHAIGATTPIGLLCRMYTGWQRDNKGLARGAERLERWSRPRKGLYYYYYATQVLHHYGGPRWRTWNGWMRDHLVKTQERAGSTRGSWMLQGSHDSAGRLYCTAMATMTLEVYYRYSPVYGDDAVRADP